MIPISILLKLVEYSSRVQRIALFFPLFPVERGALIVYQFPVLRAGM